MSKVLLNMFLEVPATVITQENKMEYILKKKKDRNFECGSKEMVNPGQERIIRRIILGILEFQEILDTIYLTFY